MTNPSRTVPRALALGLASVALAAAPSGEPLATRYAKDRAFVVTTESTSQSETLSSEMIRDGEPVERRGGGAGGGGSTRTLAFSYTDTPLEVEDGRPLKVRRAFGSVGGSSESERRGEVTEREMQSSFDDLVLVLTDDDGDVEVEVVEGDAPDDERLEGHRLTLPMDGLMPSDEVEVGDSWDLDADALARALAIDASRTLIDRPERPERPDGGRGGGGRGGMRRGQGGEGASLADAEWSGSATYTDRTEEADGLTCVVIEIEAELENEADVGDGAGTRRSEGDFKGELLWSLDEQRPVQLTLEGEILEDLDVRFESQRGVMEMSSTSRRELRVVVEVGTEAAESDD